MTKINQEQNETALPQTQWEKFETEVRQRTICELQKNIIVTRPEDGHVHVTLGENGEIHFSISPDGVTYEVENLEPFHEPLGGDLGPVGEPLSTSSESGTVESVSENLEASDLSGETAEVATEPDGTQSQDSEETENDLVDEDADLI